LLQGEIFAVNVIRIAGNNEEYHSFFEQKRMCLSRLGAFREAEERIYRDNWEDFKQMKRG